ncbi:carboxylating nicotinate-nucleotide diphosphorylase [Pararhizobium sp.]|uniref:carboxylating nicotinate-nucleotide diphosphorylase n=1 Tax=Pararhizobium sp. TaxID=1977563 RepID=UPI0027242C80|nr:carboxylating nicotinate-nucleotide diphosphorylase [Pararhizobium sp.]MDO9415068.1 carboxylating nicotinate-nucleotide diphosphorylase [Pararhizobium sp.]
MQLTAPHRLIMEPIIRAALLEDLGLAGDVTSNAVIPAGAQSSVVLSARQPGVLAGLDAARLAFELINPEIHFEAHIEDGTLLQPVDVIATVSGPSRGLLTAERTALNILSHLSGIASATAGLVEAVRGTKAQIVCTRKTTPGLRALEKYAVRAGGGMNHRFALHDALLIKDNHIAIVGSIAEAIRRAKENAGHMVKIEVEVDTLEQLADVLEIGVDAVLLDNMAPDTLRRAVAMVAGRALTEASGRVTKASVAAIAASGVDLISSGWSTHSAPALDIGLDFLKQATAQSPNYAVRIR